jgi:hypothetical protein
MVTASRAVLLVAVGLGCAHDLDRLREAARSDGGTDGEAGVRDAAPVDCVGYTPPGTDPCEADEAHAACTYDCHGGLIGHQSANEKWGPCNSSGGSPPDRGSCLDVTVAHCISYSDGASGSGVCVQPCRRAEPFVTRDTACANGTRCIGLAGYSYCLASCLTDDHCGPGLRCTSGRYCID